MTASKNKSQKRIHLNIEASDEQIARQLGMSVSEMIRRAVRKEYRNQVPPLEAIENAKRELRKAEDLMTTLRKKFDPEVLDSAFGAVADAKACLHRAAK